MLFRSCKTVEVMRELVNARDALIKDRVAALNRQAIAVSPLIKRQLAQRLRQIDSQIEAIDRRLKTLRNADSDLCQRFSINSRAIRWASARHC